MNIVCSIKFIPPTRLDIVLVKIFTIVGARVVHQQKELRRPRQPPTHCN